MGLVWFGDLVAGLSFGYFLFADCWLGLFDCAVCGCVLILVVGGL